MHNHLDKTVVGRFNLRKNTSAVNSKQETTLTLIQTADHFEEEEVSIEEDLIHRDKIDDFQGLMRTTHLSIHVEEGHMPTVYNG